jgi:hypothetical protein
VKSLKSWKYRVYPLAIALISTMAAMGGGFRAR